MLKIEIHKGDLDSFSWTDKKGVQRTGYKQSGWVHFSDKPYPSEIKLRVDDPSKTYAPGLYTLSSKSFWIDKYGSLACNPVLQPVAAAAKTGS